MEFLIKYIKNLHFTILTLYDTKYNKRKCATNIYTFYVVSEYKLWRIQWR